MHLCFSAAGPEKVEMEDPTENVLTVDQSVQAGNTAQQQGVYTYCRCNTPMHFYLMDVNSTAAR